MLLENEALFLHESIQRVWSSMFGVEAEPIEELISHGERQAFLTAMIQISGDWTGAVLIDFEPPLARELTARASRSQATQVVMDQMRDALGEAASMVAGQLKHNLPPRSSLSQPTLSTGVDYRLFMPGATQLCRVTCRCEGRRFQATVYQGATSSDVNPLAGARHADPVEDAADGPGQGLSTNPFVDPPEEEASARENGNGTQGPRAQRRSRQDGETLAKSILIVDNSRVTRMALRRDVEATGFPSIGFQEANDGREALTLLRAGDVDVLLSDLYMPEMNGMELLAAMRSEGLDVPTIFVTSEQSPEVLEQLVRAGASCVLPKPWTVEQLENALDQLAG